MSRQYALILLVTVALVVVGEGVWSQEGRPTAGSANYRKTMDAYVRNREEVPTRSDARKRRATAAIDHPAPELFDHPIQNEVEKSLQGQLSQDLQIPKVEKRGFHRKKKKVSKASNRKDEQTSNLLSLNPPTDSTAFSNKRLFNGTSQIYQEAPPGFSTNGFAGELSGTSQGSQFTPTSGKQFSKSFQDMSFWDIYGALSEHSKKEKKEKAEKNERRIKRKSRLKKDINPDP